MELLSDDGIPGMETQRRLGSLNPLEAWNCFQTKKVKIPSGEYIRGLNPLEAWNCFQTLNQEGEQIAKNMGLNPLEAWNCFQTWLLDRAAGRHRMVVLIHLKRGTAFRRCNLSWGRP